MDWKTLLGPKRVAILGVLIALNVSFFLLNSFYLKDTQSNAERELRSLQSETQKLKKEARDIVNRSEELERQNKIFEEKIKTSGFINDQNRVTVREGFSIMADLSDVISADYNVSSANIVDNKLLKRAGYSVLRSDATVNLQAINDIRIYRFLHLVTQKYPGIAKIKSFTVKKQGEVRADTLRSMKRNDPKALASGEIQFQWITISPNNEEDRSN